MAANTAKQTSLVPFTIGQFRAAAKIGGWNAKTGTVVTRVPGSIMLKLNEHVAFPAEVRIVFSTPEDRNPGAEAVLPRARFADLFEISDKQTQAAIDAALETAADRFVEWWQNQNDLPDLTTLGTVPVGSAKTSKRKTVAARK